MKQASSKYFIVGLVVVLSIGILIFGLYFLNDTNPRDKFIDYYVRFQRVSTLTDGDPVKINGVKLGRVEGMELDGHMVRVHLKIKDIARLPKNSVVKVQNIGIMGERQIGIVMGDSKELLEPGAVLEGQFDAGIAEVMGYAGEMMDSARLLLEVVKTLVDSTVAGDDFKNSFRRIVSKTEALEDRLSGILDDADPLLRSSLKNLNTASVKVNALLDENKQPIAGLMQDAQGITSNATVLMSQADSLMGRMLVLTDKLQSKDNTLGILLNDDALHTELTQTVQSADSLLQIIIKHGLDVNIDFF
jgi:phospholipid/cholesterol/gamma-HCH transport system substrate-binding protein